MDQPGDERIARADTVDDLDLGCVTKFAAGEQ
jgi:hypothetical protein